MIPRRAARPHPERPGAAISWAERPRGGEQKLIFWSHTGSKLRPRMSGFGGRSRHSIQSLIAFLNFISRSRFSISPRVAGAIGMRLNVTFLILPVNGFGDL